MKLPLPTGKRQGGGWEAEPACNPCLRTLAAHLGPSSAPPHVPPPCSFPSICSIRSAEGRHHCAATLVAPRLAVTAAYCVAPPAAESPTLWCGLHHQFSQSQGTFDVLHTVRTVRWAVLSSAQQASCPFLPAGGWPAWRGNIISCRGAQQACLQRAHCSCTTPPCTHHCFTCSHTPVTPALPPPGMRVTAHQAFATTLPCWSWTGTLWLGGPWRHLPAT